MVFVTRLPIAFIAIFVTACANQDSLYFGTYTRVGIDASTDGAGVGVKNASISVAPMKSTGASHDILGTTDMELGYTYAIIDEKVAVGDAARCAAQPGGARRMEELVAVEGKDLGPLIFGTYSSWALIDLSWGEAVSRGIHFGYKRTTGVRIPVVNDQVGSAYAHVSVNTTDNADITLPTVNGGTRTSYTYATGAAAVIKASQNARELSGIKDDGVAYSGCQITE